MPYKLAITVAGAVSLGTYEAGVLYEIVDAISQHNSSLPADSEQRIVIDVLTGASAGGMSAAVLAQKLLYEGDALDGPYNNALYRVWVEDLNLDSLLALQPDEDPTHSIFSSNFIDTLSKRSLTERYSAAAVPPQKRHPAAGERIQLGLALSNLNGVDYQYKLLPAGTFTYTRFQDEKAATVDRNADNESFWEDIRRAAVSCGAFPFAFRVRSLSRDQVDFKSPNLVPFPSSPATFTYTDGGTFQNQPLGLAKNLVDREDPHHTESDNRFYLFISPHDKGSQANRIFNEASGNFLNLTTSVVSAIFNQAGFQDWIVAEGVNQKIRNFDGRAMQLHAAILNGLDWKPLDTAAEILLPGLITGDALDKAFARLQSQFRPQYNQLAALPVNGEAAAGTWIKSILVLETAADLGERDEMKIFGITANSSELAGAALQAFLGFLRQEYRDHDYDVGRTKAQKFILENSRHLPLRNYKPKLIHPINHDLDGIELRNVPLDLRKEIQKRLEDRAMDLLDEAGINLIEREAVKLAILRPQLKKLLEISDGPEATIS